MERYESIAEGTEVYGSDGSKVGSIVAIQPNYIVVEKGFFFPTDYYIPVSAIASVGDDGVYLNVTKDAALNQGWDTEPISGDTTVGYVTDQFADTAHVHPEVAAGDEFARQTAGAATDQDTIRVPVYEEELTATTRAHEVGEVRITKDVVTEERIIDVPVTDEQVRVTRRVVDRPMMETSETFAEVVIKVPVYSEEVDIQKRVRVAEEVEVSKERVQRTERVADTVRREEVLIDDETTGARVDQR